MSRPEPARAEEAMGLRRRIVGCSLCPRLVEYRAMVKPRASFASQVYWRKPVPGFGDMNGRLLIVGLAPASSGAFRTGRIFTGDASSSFLVSALHSTGFANQPVSDSVDDGLVYKDCYLTAAVKCAPPGDKPTAEEFANCSQYLDAEIALLPNLRLVLTLGAMAFDAYVGHLRRKGADVSTLKFGHGKVYRFKTMPTLYASYHPSPRNTNTGKLTRRMLVRVLARIRKQLAQGGTESRSVRFW